MKRFMFIIVIAAISCASKKTVTVAGSEEASMPLCIKELISKFKNEEKQNPPRKIFSYTYNQKTVYYVPPICCDFFSDLYDGDCKLIAHPDGGFTGKGDGSAADFLQARTNEKLIWKDERN